MYFKRVCGNEDLIVSCVMRKSTLWFPTRSSMGLIFFLLEVEGAYFPNSETKVQITSRLRPRHT